MMTLVVDNIFISQSLRFFRDFEALKPMGMDHVVSIIQATRSHATNRTNNLHSDVASSKENVANRSLGRANKKW